MQKQRITIKQAKEVWKKTKDNILASIYFGDFDVYWKECEIINNLPEDEYNKMFEENYKRIWAK